MGDGGDGLPRGTGEPVAKPGKAKVRCEFCESEISTASGEFLALSERAKELRNLDDVLGVARAELAKLTEENARLTRELADAKAGPKPEERKLGVSW